MFKHVSKFACSYIQVIIDIKICNLHMVERCKLTLQMPRVILVYKFHR